jgi:4-amino-4-deoxy-L-arabinose transferase-like glycosyltransferase
LLLLGLVLRIWGAAEHWRWFDQRHPVTWERSKLELSQDANQYIQQADPDTWASPLHRLWTERSYFRPPLASYHFVVLFRTVHFNRMLAAGAQALLATLASLLLFLSVRRVFGRTVGLLALAAMAIHPVLMFYDGSFEDSTLAFFMQAATLWLALWAREGKPVRWLLPGTAGGLMLLARPSLVLVVAGLLVLLLGWAGKGRAKAALAYILAVAYVIAPAIWHNHSISGRLTPVADSIGQNLFWGNNPFPDYRLSVQGYWNIRDVDRGSAASLLAQGLKARTGKEFADAAYLASAITFMKEHPGQALRGLVDKAWRHLSSYEIPRNTNFEELRKNVLVWRLPYLPFAALLVLALLGARGLDRRLTWLFLLPWVAALFSEVVFFNASRYRALSVPFLIPFAVRALLMAYAGARARSWRPLVLGAALAGVAVVAGAFSVSTAERTRHVAVDRFKDAMLESYADVDGAWQRFSEERFRRFLEEARRLDPLNLDAFAVEQKYRISQGQRYPVFAMTSFRETQCRPGEWLCRDVCAHLKAMAVR